MAVVVPEKAAEAAKAIEALRDRLPDRPRLSPVEFRSLREIHRASECALQCPQRPIGSRGEANLVSPRDFQKIISLIINVLVNFNSRGEFHETKIWRQRADNGAKGRKIRGQKMAPEADLSNTR